MIVRKKLINPQMSLFTKQSLRVAIALPAPSKITSMAFDRNTPLNLSHAEQLPQQLQTIFLAKLAHRYDELDLLALTLRDNDMGTSFCRKVGINKKYTASK